MPSAGAPHDPNALRELAKRKQASFGHALLRAARLFNEQAVARVKAAGAEGLRPAHAQLLPHIDFEGTRLTVLAERVGITKQAVGELVAELERQGVVRRSKDPTDGRARQVRFTPKGIRALLHGLGVMEELEVELRAALGAAQTDALTRGLRALLAVLDRGSAP
jgi:DNA-binding MarR family transcriptional regulator